MGGGGRWKCLLYFVVICSQRLENSFKKVKMKQCNSKIGKVLPLHEADSGWISSTLYGLPRVPGMIPEGRDRKKP